MKPTLVLRQRRGRTLEDFGKLENACFGMLELPKLWKFPKRYWKDLKQPKPCIVFVMPPKILKRPQTTET